MPAPGTELVTRGEMERYVEGRIQSIISPSSYDRLSHGWRPIESATEAKDGRFVLLSGGSYYGDCALIVVIGYFVPTDPRLRAAHPGALDGGWRAHGPYGEQAYTPKYWQPLPLAIP